MRLWIAPANPSVSWSTVCFRSSTSLRMRSADWSLRSAPRSGSLYVDRARFCAISKRNFRSPVIAGSFFRFSRILRASPNFRSACRSFTISRSLFGGTDSPARMPCARLTASSVLVFRDSSPMAPPPSFAAVLTRASGNLSGGRTRCHRPLRLRHPERTENRQGFLVAHVGPPLVGVRHREPPAAADVRAVHLVRQAGDQVDRAVVAGRHGDDDPL